MMVIDDAVNDRKAKSGSFSHSLRRKKRLEDARFRYLIHANSVVSNAEEDIIHSRNFGNLLLQFFVHCRSDVEDDCSIGGLRLDGIAGVQGKIEESLVDLIGVTQDHRIARFDLRFYRDRFRQCVLEKLLNLEDDRRNRHRFESSFFRARK